MTMVLTPSTYHADPYSPILVISDSAQNCSTIAKLILRNSVHIMASQIVALLNLEISNGLCHFGFNPQ